MRARVRKFGYSAGVIIPDVLLAELGVTVRFALEMTLDSGRLVLTAATGSTCAGWAEASAALAEAGDDGLTW